MSEPANSPFSRSPSGPQTASNSAEKRRKGSSFAWLFVLLMGGLILVVEFPNEIVAWRFAAALEAREAGDKERAYQLLADVLKQAPDNIRYQNALYAWKYTDRDYQGALEILDKWIKGEPDAAELRARCNLYMHLGRYAEAIDDGEELLRQSRLSGVPPLEFALNELAYTRAVANMDLDKALAEIEPAIAANRAGLAAAEQKLQAKIEARKSTLQMREDVEKERNALASCLDTRAFIHYRRGELGAAQADFDEAIELAEQNKTFYLANKRALATKMRYYRNYERFVEQLNQQLAVLYYHRSLNFTAAKHKEKAQADWDQARELLGREPDETLL